MTPFLFALVIAAAPREGSEVRPVDQAPSTAVFLHPLTSVLFSGLGSGLSVSAGAQLGAAERWSFTVDVAVVTAPGTAPGGSEEFPATTSVSASAGPSIRLVGEGVRGVFLTPKLYVIGSSNSTLESPETSARRTRWSTVEVGAAVDLAAQWTVGPFFIGSVLGVGGGFAVSPDASSSNPTWTSSFGGALFGDMSPRSPGPTLALTLHLVRIGVAF
ncbi:MAG: hypothetical protein MUC96_36940 [Myxococcaceae bacterium]|jgi:hypothetical protein|nr:hypothetical protein [Myxococcaceae bacterium]